MSAYILAPAEALRALRVQWQQQSTGWAGDPISHWVWTQAALERLPPESRVLVLGSLTSPIGCLQLTSRFGVRLAMPLGSAWDRFVWTGVHDQLEIDRALSAAGKVANLVIPFAAPNALPSQGIGAVLRPHGAAPAVRANKWRDYLTTRSPSLKKTLRSMANRIERHPNIGPIRRLERGETAAMLPTLAAVETRGHREDGRILSASHTGSFVRQVISELDFLGNVATYVVEDSDRTIAYLIVFRGHTRDVFFTMSFASGYERLYPGVLLFSHAIRAAIEQGRTADLGNGLLPYKLRWATHIVPLNDIVLVPALLRPILNTAVQVECSLRPAQHRLRNAGASLNSPSGRN